MSIPRHDTKKTVPKEEYVNPLVFHDGRLVMRPTPFVSLAIFLWMPAGILLFLIRIMIGICLPKEDAFPLISLFGIKVRVKGAPPLLQRKLANTEGSPENTSQEGAIFVCTHRTLADPIFLSIALRRKVRALAYSISKVSEYMSPIPATRLTRNREKDARIIHELLDKEDVFICPEGTTCREPFLLRFSPLFANMTDNAVPVALNVKMSMFQGTSVRGYKALDGVFYCLNPRPSYEVIFLDPLPMDKLRAEGKSAIEIANMTQQLLADKLGFQCTNYNRKDKYNMLAGNDGIF